MFELVLLVLEDRVEWASDALIEQLGALSVSVEDADAGTAQESAIFGEPGLPAPAQAWRHSMLKALFEAESAALAAASDLLDPDDPVGIRQQSITPVVDADWVRLTQSQFEPIRINDRLWIVPSWHAAPDPAAINLELDPGLAFGTGSHPTTRLCLEWLCAKVSRGDTLLDYGCGSGILALAGAKLGAGEVVGVDIDARALEAAAENAARNRVALRLAHSQQPLSEQFDIVVANILTNPLCVLAPLIAARVKPGGQLALSGVLDNQAEQVIAAYAPHIALSRGATLEGWARLEGTRT